MHRDTDITDMLTLSLGPSEEKLLTSVSRMLTVSVKCQQSVESGVGEVSVCGVKLGRREVSEERQK